MAEVDFSQGDYRVVVVPMNFSATPAAVRSHAPLPGEHTAEVLGELFEAARDGVIEKLAVERLDGEPVIGTATEQVLVDAGFRRQPRRLVA